MFNLPSLLDSYSMKYLYFLSHIEHVQCCLISLWLSACIIAELNCVAMSRVLNHFAINFGRDDYDNDL